MCCHLQLKPLGETWSKEALTFFREQILEIYGQAMVIFRNHISAPLSPQNSAAVDIFWKDTIVENAFDPGRTLSIYLSQKLISKKFAKYIDIQFDEIDDQVNGPLTSSISINSLEFTSSIESTDKSESDDESGVAVDHWLPNLQLKPIGELYESLNHKS